MKTLYISNEKRRALLAYILSKPGERIAIRKIASELGLAPGFVSSFVKKLKEGGLVKEGKADLHSPLVRAWKILLNIETLSPFLGKLAKTTGARGIGLFGSWAQGANTEGSDVDIWIKVDRKPDDLAIARGRDLLSRGLGCETSLLVLTPEKIGKLRESDRSFYLSISKSFHLWGENLD